MTPQNFDGSPIVIRGLSKMYPKGVRAVNDVSFEVKSGHIQALLGPNGAGKTTVLKALVTLSPPTAGTVQICGFDVTKHRHDVVKRIGFVNQATTYDLYATPDSHLRLYGRLYGLSRSASNARAQGLLRQFGLEAERRRRVATLSGGMRRRLDILTALIHEPSVLIMDEPTTGLDPTGRQSVWNLIHELNSAFGITVLFTTHYLDEADQHAGNVVVIDHGEIIAEGSPAALKDRLGGTSIVLRLGAGADCEGACNVVERLSSTIRAVVSADMLQVVVRDARNSTLPVLQALFDAGVPFTSLEVRHPSLEQVYFSLTGKEFSEDEPKKVATAAGWGTYGKAQ
jgi:ABC-2 type transport system ATP-binding protein